MKKLIIILILLVSTSAFADRFIQLGCIRWGGAAIQESEIEVLGRYDIVFLYGNEANRIATVGGQPPTCSRYHASATTWNHICDANPDIEIFTYQTIFESYKNQDAVSYKALNTVDHYGAARNNPYGDLSNDNPGYIMRDTLNAECFHEADNTRVWLDFGNVDFMTWLEATIDEIYIGQFWVPDGLVTDHGWCTEHGIDCAAGIEPDYDSDVKWSSNMQDALTNMTVHLGAQGIKFAANSGPLQDPYCTTTWDALDVDNDRPYLLISENTFSTGWGNQDGVQFYNPTEWQQNLDGMGMSYIKIATHSDTVGKLDPGESALDNYGHITSFEQAVLYDIASYVLAMHDNTYFMFARTRTQSGYGTIIWLDFYDYMGDGENLHIGKPVDDYKSAALGGQTIFYREFTKGYVYVNPQVNHSTTFNLPEPCKLLDETTYNTANLESEPDITQLQLNAHRAVFLYKTDAFAPPLVRGTLGAGVVRTVDGSQILGVQGELLIKD